MHGKTNMTAIPPSQRQPPPCRKHQDDSSEDAPAGTRPLSPLSSALAHDTHFQQVLKTNKFESQAPVHAAIRLRDPALDLVSMRWDDIGSGKVGSEERVRAERRIWRAYKSLVTKGFDKKLREKDVRVRVPEDIFGSVHIFL